eukprot:13712773-Ditylum_brightwellii.AAC.1
MKTVPFLGGGAMQLKLGADTTIIVPSNPNELGGSYISLDVQLFRTAPALVGMIFAAAAAF